MGIRSGLPEPGYQILATGSWRPGPRYQIPATKSWLPDPGYQILATRSWLPDPGYQILATRSWLTDRGHQIQATRTWLPDLSYQILAATAMRATLGDENIDFHLFLLGKRDFETKSINMSLVFIGFPKIMLLWLQRRGATDHRAAATASFFS